MGKWWARRLELLNSSAPEGAQCRRLDSTEFLCPSHRKGEAEQAGAIGLEAHMRRLAGAQECAVRAWGRTTQQRGLSSAFTQHLRTVTKEALCLRHTNRGDKSGF